MQPFNSLPQPTSLFQKPINSNFNFSFVERAKPEKQKVKMTQSLTFNKHQSENYSDSQLQYSDHLVIPQPQSRRYEKKNFDYQSSIYKNTIEKSPNFFEELQNQAKNTHNIKKYLKIEDNDKLDDKFFLGLIDQYKPFFEMRCKGGKTMLGSIAKSSFGSISPIFFQIQTANSYFSRKINGKNLVFSSDEEKEYIGPITKAERRRKLKRWKAKRERGRSTNTPRYGIRRKLAQKRERHHGRFIKSKKRSISELAKAMKSCESLSNSMSCSSSRKNSISTLIGPMSNLSLNDKITKSQVLSSSVKLKQKPIFLDNDLN